MRTPLLAVLAACLWLGLAPTAHAAPTNVIGGKTSILLDQEALGLCVTAISGDVMPGDLGPESVAFSINPRDAAVLPTTFSYDSDNFAPFSGTIEHSGTVTFNDTIILGGFTIAFDAARAVGDLSGFYVASTIGTDLILFDLDAGVVEPDLEWLVIASNLFVAPELASFLGEPSLDGQDVGAALVNAISTPVDVPEPAALLLLALSGAALRLRRS